MSKSNYNNLYKINELATQFYQEQLKSSKEAQDYLKQRYINDETIKNFRLGYAPDENKLYIYLLEQGYTMQEITETGLCTKSENGTYVDKFQNRLIFPIINAENEIVAFGARVLNNDKPQYINTVDNDIYTKTNNLYGINIAKNYCNDYLIIVEGYIDLVILYQTGIKNAVALLGTAITDEQIKLVKRYTNNIMLALDTDLAGKHATARAIEKLEMFNMNYAVIDYTGAKDPDEYINKFGADKFKNHTQH